MYLWYCGTSIINIIHDKYYESGLRARYCRCYFLVTLSCLVLPHGIMHLCWLVRHLGLDASHQELVAVVAALRYNQLKGLITHSHFVSLQPSRVVRPLQCPLHNLAWNLNCCYFIVAANSCLPNELNWKIELNLSCNSLHNGLLK